MVTIRNEQMDAFYAASYQIPEKELVPHLITQLRRLKLVDERAFAELDVTDDLVEGSLEIGDEARRARAVIEAQVRRDVETGRSIGIVTPDGLLQFVSYAFTINAQWQERPELRDVLSQSGLSERERLAAIHGYLCSI